MSGLQIVLVIGCFLAVADLALIELGRAGGRSPIPFGPLLVIGSVLSLIVAPLLASGT
jgi:prepilin signal peptidase PulO-like enzyme (type II secretory pathway)